MVIAWRMKEFKKRLNQYEKKNNAFAGIKSDTKISTYENKQTYPLYLPKKWV